MAAAGPSLDPLLASGTARKGASASERLQDLPAVFNLAVAVLGPGILSMPFVLREAGLLAGSLLLVLAALACDYTTARLCECAWALGGGGGEDGGRHRSLEAVMGRSFGPSGHLAATLIVSLYLFGCICGNLVAVVPLLQRVLLAAFGLTASRAAIVAGLSVLELPLCLVSDLGALGRGSSALGLLATLVLPLLLAGQLAASGGAAEPLPLLGVPSLSTAFPLALYAFTAQPYCLPIFFDEVAAGAPGAGRAPLVRRQRLVGAWAIGLAFALQYSVGLLGAALFGLDVQSNLLLSFSGSDVLALWLSGTTALSVCLCLPMNYFPLGQILDQRRWRSDRPPAVGPAAHVLHAVAVLGVAGIVAATVEDISIVFDITGSSASALLVFVIPCVAWLRLVGGSSWPAGLVTAVLGIGSLCSFVSFFLTVASDFKA